MSAELDVRLEIWLEDIEENAPLKLFVIGGIALIAFLLLLGFVTSRYFCYFTINIMIQMGLLEDIVIPLEVVDVVRHAIVSAVTFLFMLSYLADLEGIWLLTREMIER